MNYIWPEILHAGIKFRAIHALKKCLECDKYGRIVRKEGNGCYYPYCSCQFGQYKKTEMEDDMSRF